MPKTVKLSSADARAWRENRAQWVSPKGIVLRAVTPEEEKAIFPAVDLAHRIGESGKNRVFAEYRVRGTDGVVQTQKVPLDVVLRVTKTGRDRKSFLVDIYVGGNRYIKGREILRRRILEKHGEVILQGTNGKQICLIRDPRLNRPSFAESQRIAPSPDRCACRGFNDNPHPGRHHPACEWNGKAPLHERALPMDRGAAVPSLLDAPERIESLSFETAEDQLPKDGTLLGVSRASLTPRAMTVPGQLGPRVLEGPQRQLVYTTPPLPPGAEPPTPPVRTAAAPERGTVPRGATSRGAPPVLARGAVLPSALPSRPLPSRPLPSRTPPARPLPAHGALQGPFPRPTTTTGTAPRRATSNPLVKAVAPKDCSADCRGLRGGVPWPWTPNRAPEDGQHHPMCEHDTDWRRETGGKKKWMLCDLARGVEIREATEKEITMAEVNEQRLGTRTVTINDQIYAVELAREEKEKEKAAELSDDELPLQVSDRVQLPPPVSRKPTNQKRASELTLDELQALLAQRQALGVSELPATPDAVSPELEEKETFEAEGDEVEGLEAQGFEGQGFEGQGFEGQGFEGQGSKSQEFPELAPQSEERPELFSDDLGRPESAGAVYEEADDLAATEETFHGYEDEEPFQPVPASTPRPAVPGMYAPGIIAQEDPTLRGPNGLVGLQQKTSDIEPGPVLVLEPEPFVDPLQPRSSSSAAE